MKVRKGATCGKIIITGLGLKEEVFLQKAIGTVFQSNYFEGVMMNIYNNVITASQRYIGDK